MSHMLSERFGNVGRDGGRSLAAQKWGAVLGGAALALYGLSRRSPIGILMAATGGAVAYAGSRTETTPQEMESRSSILLNCVPQEAYRFWHDFENFPRFMHHVESVEKIAEQRYRWTVAGPFGNEVRWDAEIDQDRENEYISWHSLPGSDLKIAGFVRFQPAPAKRGTILETFLEFRAPGRGLASRVAKIIGKDPGFLMRQDLRRLKALIETGEIPTTEGQTHGPRSAMTALARMADPDRPFRRNARLREVFQAKRRVA